MSDALILNGQNEEADVAVVNTMAGNDALAEVGMSKTSEFMSEQIRSMLTAPDFRHQVPFMSESDIQRRSAEKWISPADYTVTKDIEYKMDEPSDTLTVVKDAAKRFGMGLLMMGDHAAVGAGGLLAKASGGKIGVEMQKRAYDSLDSQMAAMESTYAREADLNTLASDITSGALSMLEMFGASITTGGIAPLVQMGVDAFGGGTYNNMRKYAEEHDGSIEGFEGNWSEIAVDLANATMQVAIEKEFGMGNKRWAQKFEERLFGKKLLGQALKDFAKNAFQEGSQSYLTDLAEYIKGNDEAPKNWSGYMRAAAIGGFMGSALSAMVHGNARIKADKTISDLVMATRLAKNPKADLATVKKEADAFAKKFNNDVEDRIIKGTWDELADRLDTNNDRGKVRNNLVEQFTKARVAALGLESAEDLDPDELADIQDAATVAAGEAFRESFAEGVPIEQTMTARLVADGKNLVVRDLTPEERGVREVSKVELQSDEERLAQQIATERETLARERLQEDLAARQQQLDEERARRQADIEELQAWAEQQVRLGEEIGARRERGQTAISKREIERWLGQSARGEQTRAREEYKATQFEARQQEKAQIEKLKNIVKDKTKKIATALEKQGRKVNVKKSGGDIYNSPDSSSYLFVTDDYGVQRPFRISFETESKGDFDRSFYGDMSVEDIVNNIISRLEQKYYPLKDRKQFVGKPENNQYQPLFMRRQRGLAQQSLTGKDKPRGRYQSDYQRIILNKDSDISTILHELSHMWLNNYFKAYCSNNAPESFKKWWKPVERALGIRESDRYLDKEVSERFARSFEKWVLDGGKGTNDSLTPVFERLSKRLADIYDGLSARYFDMVGDLKPEVQAWFAKNEELADSIVVAVPERDEKTGEETIENVRVRVRDRSEERQVAQKMIKEENAAQKVVDRESDVINDIVETETQLAADSDEPAKSPYTAEGQREQRTSQRIRETARAEGVLIDSRRYDPMMSRRAAEDAVVFATADLDSAFEVAMGRKNAPGDIPRIAVFFAVQNKLMLNPVENAARLQELALNSPVIEELSRAGQQLRMAGVALSKDNPMRILRDLSKMYDENLTDAERASITENINKINDYIARADLNTEDVWNKILSDMECRS